MTTLTVSPEIYAQLQHRATQDGCSVDALLARLLDTPPKPKPALTPDIYQLVLEHTSDSVSLFDPDLRYVYVNPILERLTGLKVSEMIGKTDRELGTPEENLQFWRSAWDDVIATREEKIITFALTTPDGEGWYESRLTPIYDDDDTLQYLFSITRDVTERKQSEDMLADIAGRLPGMILRYRLYPDGRYEAPFVGDGVRDIYGLTAEEASADIGKVWAKLHPDDVEQVFASVQASAETLSLWHDEWRIQLDNGDMRWVAGRGTPRRLEDGSTVWNTVILDITARKQSEEALRQLNQRFSILFHLTPAPLALTNFRTGELIEVNEAFALSFGYESDHIRAQTVEALQLWVNEDERDELNERIRNEKSVTNLEIQLRTKSGEIRDFLGAFALWVLDGESVVLSALIDMTEYKRLETKAHKAELLRVELDKEKELVALKDRFISVISHEFRMPLAVIKSSSQLLEKYLHKLEAERRDDAFERINMQIEQLTDMIDELLAFSRTQSNQVKFTPEPINVTHFCNTLFERIQSVDDKTHHYTFISELGDAVMMVDTHLLRHMVNNLLSNAIKYSPENTQITLMLLQEDENIILKISDEGIGIPEDDQIRLFQPFHRANNVGAIEGTGLGLSIVREYAILHGGTVSVASTINVGSVFTVTLPAIKLSESL